MPLLKTEEEIALMEESAQLVSKTLGMLASEIQPGVTTKYLDQRAETFIRDHGGIPGFLGMYNFPNTLCISKNEEIVHGIPSEYALREGDILSIDCGVLMNGFYGDHAYTFEVGEVAPAVKKLINITKKSLYEGLKSFKIGNTIGDVGHAIQSTVQKEGYGIVRELVGHGLGRSLHEDPQVPNYGTRSKGPKIVEGLAIAIEPMINLGTGKVKMLKDGWTIVTKDGKCSAHFEHNIAICGGVPKLLSTFKYIYEALNIPDEDPKIG